MTTPPPYATFNDPPGGAEPQQSGLDAAIGDGIPWKDLTWKQRLAKTAFYGGALAAGMAVGSVVFKSNPRPSTLTANGGPSYQMPVLNSHSPTSSTQWQPWMSQGQYNPYDGRMYYPR